jgi:hypothetical protein
MTRAIVWKEFREQGLIALTLLVLGSGILAATASLAEPPAPRVGAANVVRMLGTGVLATLLLAVTAGTVCGGALFAAEREAGTIGFLESLPISRWRLWRAKFIAGALLASIQVAFVLAVAAALGLVETTGAVLAIAIYSLLAFTWGMYGSTLARTTLGSVGVAIPTAIFAALLFLIPIMAIYPNNRTNLPRLEGAIVFIGLMFATPLLGSAFRFTREDRDRAADDRTPSFGAAAAKSNRPRPLVDPSSWHYQFGLRALAWLTVRQLLMPGLAICAFAVLLGVSLLVESVQPVLVWPILGLTAGVLAGVTAFADEQSHDVARFWGERRFPLGRLWVVKITIHALFASALVILMLLPSIVRSQSGPAHVNPGGSFLSAVFRTLLFDHSHLGLYAWNFVVLPVAYGFAAGHLCGLLFRKVVVAAGVAGLVGGTAGAFWVPSILAGGVHPWQLWLPPALTLLAGRRLLRAWAANRVASRAALGSLAGGIAAVVLLIAAGIGYRVVEVPDDPASEDDVLYVAGLASLEINDSGRQFRTAAERYDRIAQSIVLSPERSDRSAASRRASVSDRLLNVPYTGWQAGDADLVEWMSKIYENDQPLSERDETWYIQASRASRDRSGIFEHPLRTGTPATLTTQMHARRMASTIIGHALRRQSEGRPDAFLDDLRTTLALGRSMRNGSVISALLYGNDIAKVGFAGAERWIAELGGHPDLLRQALLIVQEDESKEPFDPRPHLLAERYVMREFTKGPGQWLPVQLSPPGQDRELVAPVVDMVGVVWNVPWERERSRRLLGVGFEASNLPTRVRALIRGRPGWTFMARHGQSPADMMENDRQLRVNRRALLLALAIRLHIAEKGTPPAALTELVSAGYLPTVPLDPYDDRPFRYRVSTGEVLPSPITLPSANSGIPMMKSPSVPVPEPIAKGQPILWSVGRDFADSNGRNAATRFGVSGSGQDFVFIVPLAAGKH